jgi:hypothetical protein
MYSVLEGRKQLNSSQLGCKQCEEHYVANHFTFTSVTVQVHGHNIRTSCALLTHQNTINFTPTHINLNPFQSNFLPPAHSPALICFGRERGWRITSNYPTVVKEKNMEKQKEYNLRYLLSKVRTT